jgi:hypothetical protein
LLSIVSVSSESSFSAKDCDRLTGKDTAVAMRKRQFSAWNLPRARGAPQLAHALNHGE